MITQHESTLIPHAARDFSLLEVSVWGHLFYAVEVEEILKDVVGIHFYAFLGTILVFLLHAKSALTVLGYDGPLLIRTQMLRIRDVPFLTFKGNTPITTTSSPLDDEVQFDMETSTAALKQDSDAILGSIAKRLFLALNYPDPAMSEDAVEKLVSEAKDYSLLTPRKPEQPGQG